MQEEKRAARRFLYSQTVSYGVPEVSAHGSIGINISISGVALKVQGFIPIGNLLELQLRLKDSPKLIWVKARVVRIRQLMSDDCYEVGLKFIKDESNMTAIGSLIASYKQ